jgi:hypothetical protein
MVESELTALFLRRHHRPGIGRSLPVGDLHLKTANRYLPPGEVYRAGDQPRPSPGTRLSLAMTGLYIGFLCGAVSGFLSGAELGLTFRLVHQSDILAILPPFRWFFESISTPLDFALYHGTLVLLPLGVLGASWVSSTPIALDACGRRILDDFVLRLGRSLSE